MESLLYKDFTIEELEVFKNKNFTKEEIIDLCEDLIEYYVNAGLPDDEIREDFEAKSDEDIIKHCIHLKKEYILNSMEYKQHTPYDE